MVFGNLWAAARCYAPAWSIRDGTPHAFKCFQDVLLKLIELQLLAQGIGEEMEDLDPDVYNDRRDRFVVEEPPPTYTLFLGDVLVPQLTTLPALYFPTGQHLMLQQWFFCSHLLKEWEGFSCDL